jgi:hypothetical protein
MSAIPFVREDAIDGIADQRLNKGPGRHESARRDQVGLADETKFKGRPFSALKSLRPQQGVEQVTQQAGSDEGGE